MGNLERHLSPDSVNPLNSGFNFLFTILYTLILKDFLEQVLENAGKIPWQIWPLVVLLLLEVLHFALEDYLFTKNLSDSLSAEDVRLTVVRYLLHFAGIVALYCATFVVGNGLEELSEPVTAAAIRPLIAAALFWLAIQYGTFALWQGTVFYEKWRDWDCGRLEVVFFSGYNPDLEEARAWTPRFAGYTGILLLLAVGVSTSWDLLYPGKLELVLAAFGVPVLMVGSYILRLCRYDQEKEMSTYHYLARLFGIFSITAAGLAFLELTTWWIVVTLAYLTLKADYFDEWRAFNAKLLGLDS